MVSIVIPSYNSADTIKKCLDALLDQTYSGAYEIILVDSSDDQTPDIVNMHFPDIHFIHMEQQTGRGQTRNIGIKKASGDPILFIDSDCVASPDWVERLVRLHQKNNYAAIGGSVINGNDKSSNIGWAGYLAEFREFTPYHPAALVKHIPTCNISYKKWVFDKIGGFSTNHFLPEDHDFNLNLIEAGNDIYFEPEISVKHRHRASCKQFLKHQKYIGRITSTLILKRKLKGYALFRYPVLSFFLLPFIAGLKFINTVLLFAKQEIFILIRHPLSVAVFAVGLFPWMKGFFSGTRHYKN